MFPEFRENTIVHKANVLEKSGTLRGWALEWSKSLFSERKGIRATDGEALKRRDKGVC